MERAIPLSVWNICYLASKKYIAVNVHNLRLNVFELTLPQNFYFIHHPFTFSLYINFLFIRKIYAKLFLKVNNYTSTL